MKRIDSHQHFWQFDPVRDGWITEEMEDIRKDFMPHALLPELDHHEFDGCVAVQADQSEDETNFLISLSSQHNFIRGVVGWTDLTSPNIAARLSHFSSFPVVKGFRHVLQGEQDRAYMLKPEFKNGIGLLGRFNFTYDLLILPDQLLYAQQLVATFPNQKFVIDHLAKPPIRLGNIKEWKTDLTKLAQFENVYCKISGLVTEADLMHWKQADFIPYLDTAVEAFGTKRILYGSDWPVCLLGGTYQETYGIVSNYFSTFSKEDQRMFFGGNAIDFYNLT